MVHSCHGRESNVKSALNLCILSGCLSLLLGLRGAFSVFALPERAGTEPDDYAVEVLVREALGRADPPVDGSTESLVISAAGLADAYAETISHLVDLVLYGSLALLLVSMLCFAAAFRCHRLRAQ